MVQTLSINRIRLPHAMADPYGGEPKPKHPPGPAMTLGNMRALGVQGLVAS